MKIYIHSKQANKLLRELSQELGDDNADHAFKVLVAVLHTLRSILTLEESKQLITRLPACLKQIYADGWNFCIEDRIKSMNDFIENLQANSDKIINGSYAKKEEARENFQAVLNVLKHYLNRREMQMIVDEVPLELAELWISQAQSHTDKYVKAL